MIHRQTRIGISINVLTVDDIGRRTSDAYTLHWLVVLETR